MSRMEQKSGKILSICHVLRYSPFFSKLKELLDAGVIGQLVSVQHIESVGYWHAAHSFVRGNWRHVGETSPMILAKCCHDMDILLWLIGGHCTSVSSFGSLAHFCAEHAPKDAPKHCMDGCPHRDSCPYYAPRFYLEHPNAVSGGFVKTVSLDTNPQAVLHALEKGPYGRCVYYCDNDVVDNQVVNMQFDHGVTVSMTMCAFTGQCERIINLMGSRGQIRGNMECGTIEWCDFATGTQTTLALNTPTTGHSGSDSAMMKDFVKLVASDRNNVNRSSAKCSVESHLMALAAGKSRLEQGEPISISVEKERELSAK